MRAKAQALGLTFSRIDAGKVEEANGMVTGREQRHGNDTPGHDRNSPFLTTAADVFTSIGIKFVSAFKTAIPPVVGSVTSAFDIILPIVTSAGTAISSAITATWSASITPLRRS